MTVSWQDLDLSLEHQAILEEKAIKPEIASSLGARSVLSVSQLPEEFHSFPDVQELVPAIMYKWNDLYYQLRPDKPTKAKYLWAKGKNAHFAPFRETGPESDVLIVEGTKQAMSAASWAPKELAVYGIPGCLGWLQDGVPTPDLGVVDGRNVYICLDADTMSNVMVYDAGIKLAEACKMEGCKEVKFIVLPAGRKAGLDDLLGARPSDRRTMYMQNLIQAARDKPAPYRPKSKANTLHNDNFSDRPTVEINTDRLTVINRITELLVEKWDKVQLFSYGGILVTRRGTELVPVNRDIFSLIVAKTAYTVARNERNENISYTPAWPDDRTMGATLHSADAFSELETLLTVPFMRPDGSICTDSGYDGPSRVFLDLDESLKIFVSANPTNKDANGAVNYLLTEWLGDFPFQSESDKANMLALILTPFLRMQVPLVPMAVLDGLQMGVGKTLLADCLSILLFGQPSETLPYTYDDDAEQKKIITSAFRSGSTLFVFDEAHHLSGHALARAITAITYRDRILGLSTLAEFPNRVTWVAMGNQISVSGDMTRRVYRIRLQPQEENPHDRQSDDFVHPDLREWTAAHRSELLSAVLTVLKSWFVAGKPESSKKVSFGSFESWEHKIGGILQNAGVVGFLDEMGDWRETLDFDRQYWGDHFLWLAETFGDDPFTCSEVVRALSIDMNAEPPPITSEADSILFSRKLGRAYRKQNEKQINGYFLTAGGLGHTKVRKWALKSATLRSTEGSVGMEGRNTTTPVGENIISTEGSESRVSQPGGVVVIPEIPTLPSRGEEVSPEINEYFIDKGGIAEITCDVCKGRLELVPPSFFWFACRSCSLQTFEGPSQ